MKLVKILRNSAVAVFITTSFSAGAHAETTKLSIQNHNSPDSQTGRLIGKFVDDVEAMSNGDIDIEMFYSASVVEPSETFDAAVNGVLSCDMTNGSYQAGRDPAFQFVADPMGGYDMPQQFIAWVEEGGGRELIDELYAEYGMAFVGNWTGGQEALSSTSPLAGIADLEGFKFRSPPGMESEIFASLGAKPVVMDFTEIFTALETKIIDGADSSTLANNRSIGIYDIAKYATFPGFHSMSADHLACNRSVWEAVPIAHQEIIKAALDKLRIRIMNEVMINDMAATSALEQQGVTLYNWSAEDREAFRQAAIAVWDDWAMRSPAAARMVESHKAFIERLGL